ncbi:MAG: hypothetical protein ACTTJC_08810, partial [Campylobacter sp.]
MKISKIACVFLLGAGLSVTSLFANLSNENEEYMKAKNGQTNEDADYTQVVEAIKKLKSYDSGVLAKWSGDDQNDPGNNNEKINKEISDQLDHIKELLDQNKNVFLKTKDGKGELQVKNDNGNRKITLTLKGDNGDKVEEKDFSLNDLKKNGAKHDLVKKMFDPKYKALWEELIAKFEEFHQKNQQERIRKAALNFAKSNIGEDDLINAYAIGQKDLLNALKSEITKQEADVEAKQKSLQKAKSDAEAKLNETKGKLDIPDLSSENLEAKENQLKSDKISISGASKNNENMTSSDMEVYAKQLKNALTDGIKPTEEVSNDKIEEALKKDKATTPNAPDQKAKATELDKIKDKMDNLIDEATQALEGCKTENGKVKTAEGALDTANKNAKDIKDKLDSFKKRAAGPSVLKKTLDELDPNKDGSAANELKKSEAELPPLQKSLDDEVKKVDGSKVTLKGTTANDISNQDKAIGEAKKALSEAKALQNGEKVKKQKEGLKKAIQAGIPIKDENGAKNLKEEEIDSKDEVAIGKIVNGNGGQGGAEKSIAEAEEALKKAKEAAQKVKEKEEEINTNKSGVEELKKGLSLASNARLEAIKNLANLDPKSDQILSTLSELISQSDVVQNFMSNADTKELIQGIQELHSTLDESSKT